jgi:hypothetical protein
LDFQFWLGLILGSAVTYIVKEIFDAFNKVEQPHEKLARCTLEVIKRDAHLELDKFSDEELVRAVLAGVKAIARGDDKSGSIHPKVRD